MMNTLINKIKQQILLILDYIENRRKERKRISTMKGFDGNLAQFIIDNSIPKLPKEETIKIQNYWEPLLKYKVGDQYYRIVKANKLNHFSYPLYQYISESIMYPNIIRHLNPLDASKVLANKGLYGIYFEKFKIPTEIIKNIKGGFYDAEMNLINKDDALAKILEFQKPIIIKPIIDTYGGRGIKVLHSYTKEKLKDTLNEYQQNFVIQEIIKQSEQTKQFNPTSLNTFRIVTLLLNGKLSILAKTFRCGGKNAIVDNAFSGGMFVGINSKGELSSATSHHTLTIHNSPTGLKFSDYTIHHFDRILDFALSLHKSLPLCAFAGWDIALDDNDNPVLIEVNLNTPELCLLQIVNGPIFGNRFEEVIDYVFNKR